MKKNLTFVILLMLSVFVRAQDSIIQVPAEKLDLVKSFKLGAGSNPSGPTVNVVAANALYSNVTNFLGQGLANDGATTVSGNIITAMLADDITMVSNPTYIISAFRFSVVNFNSVNVSARALVRFYADNAGMPGTYLTGFNFNPITFVAGTVNVYNYTLPAAFNLTQQKIWAGITFDNNAGSTGATIDQMNNLGQGLFNPVDKGTSDDLFFETTAAGSFTSNNPAGGIYNLQGNPVANFGWEFVSSTPLPISLTSFNAVKNGKTNILSWTTAQEINSSQIIIERSSNASTYLPIGTVAAAGNTSVPQNYTFTDALPNSGTNYYRLKLVDKDGTFTYSKIVTLSTDQVSTSVYPTLANDFINVNIYSATLLNTKANIYDGSGRLVRSVQLTNNQQQINVQPLAKGMYILTFIDGTSQKFVKQ